MPHRPRNFGPSGVYHVTCRGNNRAMIFRSDDDRSAYLALLHDIQRRVPFELFHYCLMGNHVHLVIRTIDDPPSTIMKRLNHCYTYYVKRKYGFKGQFWEGRYRAEHIDDDEYLLTCGIYVELNPVRAGIVGDPADHFWSSYRHYTEGVADALITHSPAYLGLSDNERQRRRIYRLLCRQWMTKK